MLSLSSCIDYSPRLSNTFTVLPALEKSLTMWFKRPFCGCGTAMPPLIQPKPSYMALKQDECNATVEVTEKTGLEVINTESFDVNVCKKEINKIIN